MLESIICGKNPFSFFFLVFEYFPFGNNGFVFATCCLKINVLKNPIRAPLTDRSISQSSFKNIRPHVFLCLKINLFIKISPQKFRLKCHGARDFLFWKWQFSSRSPPFKIVWPCMTSSKKFREKYQRILFFEKRSFHQDCPPQISFKTFRVHMILSFENRSFHEYRPQKFR